MAKRVMLIVQYKDCETNFKKLIEARGVLQFTSLKQYLGKSAAEFSYVGTSQAHQGTVALPGQ